MAGAQKEELKGENFTLTIQKEPACKIVYNIKVVPSFVLKSHKEAVRKVSKGVSIPGFRKGKAPEQMILQRFDKPVNQEWHRAVADHAFKESQKLSKIEVLNGDSRIGYDMVSCTIEQGAEMNFYFESEPEVPKVDTSLFFLKPTEKPVVDDKQVEDMVDRIRGFFGEWKYITDRPVEKGDFVRIDLDLLGKGDPSRAISNTRFEVEEDKMAKWMYDLVLGMKTGEEKEGVSTPDETASEKEKKEFEPKKVKLIITAIEKCHLPPIDDELAKKVGVATAKEMTSRLEKLLNKQSSDVVQKDLRDQISDKLIQEYGFDLPNTLVDREFKHRLETAQQSPQFRNKMKMLNAEEQEKERMLIRLESVNAIRLFYLCRKIVTDNDIEITQSDLRQNVEVPLDAMFADPALLNAAKDPEQKAVLFSRVMLDKSQDFVIEKALKNPPPKDKPKAEKKLETKPSEKAPPKESAKKPPAKKKASAPKTTEKAPEAPKAPKVKAKPKKEAVKKEETTSAPKKSEPAKKAPKEKTEQK